MRLYLFARLPDYKVTRFSPAGIVKRRKPPPASLVHITPIMKKVVSSAADVSS